MPTTFRSVAHGQLADWEGGRFATGELTAVTSDSVFTDTGLISVIPQFHTSRVIEFTSGTAGNIGVKRTISAYNELTKTLTVSVAFPEIPQIGDEYKIYPAGDFGTAAADFADGTTYHRVWSWRNSGDQNNKQIRRKFADPSPTGEIPPSDLANAQITVTHLHVATSLAYIFAKPEQQGSANLTGLIADWVSEDALVPSGTIFDDAIWFATYKVEEGGQVHGRMTGVCPASRLSVPPRIPMGHPRRAIWTRSQSAIPYGLLGFERSLDIDAKLPFGILVVPGETLEIYMKMGIPDMAYEYDIWLAGRIQ